MNGNEKLDQFPILLYFGFGHLPMHLQSISKPFADLADDIVDRFFELEGSTLATPDKAETTEGLRKLLEAKDCVVRSLIARR